MMTFYILFAIDWAMLLIARVIHFSIKKYCHQPYHPKRFIWIIYISILILSFFGNIGYKTALVASIAYFIVLLFAYLLTFIAIILKAISNI